MKRLAAGGFTIVETMIVLAVSGVLFISLVGVIQGQQNKMQFKTSMTDIVTNIQSTISEVSNGNYPVNGGGFACEAVPGASGVAPRISTAWDANQAGSNDDCTFMGQAIMFGVCRVGETEKYTIQTLVGLRHTPTGQEPANFDEAEIRVMAPGTGAFSGLPYPDKELVHGYVARGTLASAGVTHDLLQPEGKLAEYSPWKMLASVPPAPEDDGCGGTNPPGGTPNFGVTKSLAFGTTIEWMRYDDAVDNSNPIAGFAIITSPGGQTAGGGVAESGTVLTNIIPIPCGTVPNCTSQGADQAHGVDAITDRFGGANGVNAKARGVKLCFLSATTNQSSLVHVGANGGNNSIEMTIHNNQDCS